MPKERIYAQPSKNDPTIAHDLSIQWEKAQLMAERDNDGYHGNVSLSLVPPTENAPVALGYFDRTALNKAIQVLRRARDQAFGADA
jgi:hypothetical protein